MKELPKKDKSTFIVGFWGDTWIASELHKIDKIKEGKFYLEHFGEYEPTLLNYKNINNYMKNK